MKYSINISSAELLYLTVEAETEPFEARRASNKKSGWGMKCLIHFFSSNVHERIRTSDLPLRSSKRRPRELYQISSKTAYFRAFFRVPVLCQDRFLSLFFALLSSKLLQLCCKPQNFNEWLA